MTWSKRLFDLVFASVGLVILLPFLALIALCIVLDDRGPAFFRQERVGVMGRPFRILKFRTMVVDAESKGRQLTVGRDPRISRIGHMLRRTKLDELPQLFNVVVGDMSLVGPRPEVPRYVALYTAEQRRVLELVPGITDEASIRYRHESDVLSKSPNPERTYIDVIMPDKIRINLEYAGRSTVWSDCLVIIRTIFDLSV